MMDSLISSSLDIHDPLFDGPEIGLMLVYSSFSRDPPFRLDIRPPELYHVNPFVKFLTSDKKPFPRLPPGPWKLPLIGNIHQLLAGSQPHCTLRNLALNRGPLMHLQLGAVSTVVISSPEIAKEAMRKNDTAFASRLYQLAPSIRVRSFRRVREEMVSKFIETISSCRSSPINLSHQIFSLTYRITAAAAFGSVCNEEEKFQSIITEVIRLATGLTIADFYPSINALQMVSGIRPKLEKLHGEADRILENIIAEHKERRINENGSGGEEKDIVNMLLDLQEHGNLDFSLSSNNIKSVILDIFAAGSETSSTIVERAMSELLKNPTLMEKAKAEVRKGFNGKGLLTKTGKENKRTREFYDVRQCAYVLGA
ncbi:Detected protein of confused Function [Hibiscus syriacus]|uniref:Detected protein of confused Function n=1 Tax=Hibiscus syriacus TaxID=106335 RepID=A0A6A2YLQ0_HIBSY|nr:Detected protein of confused Function [Hibiscus syriacus]